MRRAGLWVSNRKDCVFDVNFCTSKTMTPPTCGEWDVMTGNCKNSGICTHPGLQTYSPKYPLVGGKSVDPGTYCAYDAGKLEAYKATEVGGDLFQRQCGIQRRDVRSKCLHWAECQSVVCVKETDDESAEDWCYARGVAIDPQHDGEGEGEGGSRDTVIRESPHDTPLSRLHSC